MRVQPAASIYVDPRTQNSVLNDIKIHNTAPTYIGVHDALQMPNSDQTMGRMEQFQGYQPYAKIGYHIILDNYLIRLDNHSFK